MAMCKANAAMRFSKSAPSPARSEASSESYWVPNYDVYAADTGLVIKVELAGMRREDLRITAEGNHLTISGSRPDGCRGGQCRFIVMEINYGPFEIVVDVPNGYDLSKARAVYQNGFLRVDISETARSTQKVSVPVTSNGR